MILAAIMNEIRVILVGGSDLFRNLLRVSLGQYKQLRVVGDYRDGQLALSRAPEAEPDVAVVDADPHGVTYAIQVGRTLRGRWPGLKMLLLADFPHPFSPAPTTGTLPPNERHPEWSCLLKSSVHQLASLVRAIESTAAGLLVLDPDMAARAGRHGAGTWARLPLRQLEILGLMAQGYNNAAIARQLGIARKTVENQINALYHQLGLNRHDSPFHPRVRAVLLYLQGGSSE